MFKFTPNAIVTTGHQPVNRDFAAMSAISKAFSANLARYANSILLGLTFSMSPFLAAGAVYAQAASTKPFQETVGANPRLSATSPDQNRSRRINLQVGKSFVFDLPSDAKEVFVANPAIANAVVRSSRKIYIIGMSTGSTTIFVNGNDGQQIAVLDMTVARELGRELTLLRDLLKETFPKANIEVRSVGTSLVLSGVVDSALDMQRATDIASSLAAGISSSDSATVAGNTASSASTSKIINALQVRGRDQVMIKVTVAEVQKTIIKRLGVDLSGSWKVGAGTFGLSTLDQGTDPKALSFTRGGTSATIRALEEQNAFHTLAEPTLTAISGESAKFLAGGEIPLTQRTCNQGTCLDTITYKPVGVSLAFTPIVLSEGRISLRVSTEVTERDDANSVVSAGLNVPGFKTRKTETTVELPSGGSLATAGLIQQKSAVTNKGLPGLMSIPILGTLARSREFQRNETELLIIVSPYIVKPVEPSALARPDDGFVDASDPAGMFLGRVNRLYGTTGSSRNIGSYRGNVGFITE